MQKHHIDLRPYPGKSYFTAEEHRRNFDKNNKKDVAYQYVEKLENGKFAKTLIKENEGNLSLYIAHEEFNKEC